MADGELGPNEMAVLAAASRIYGGFAATGNVKKSNSKDVFNYSLDTALRMAKTIDRTTRVEGLMDNSEAPFPFEDD